MEKTNKNKGIMFIIISAFFFALMSLFIRLSGDLPSVQKSFFRNLIAFIFAATLLLKDKSAITINKGSLKYFLLRSIMGTIGILCNFYAVDHLLLADASMLNKMSPFFAILFSYIMLKEKIKPSQGIAVLIAFLGSLFIIKPSITNMDLFPSIIGLLGGMSAGLAYTAVRKLGELGAKGKFIVFFFSGFSCLVTLPFLLFNYHPMTLKQIFFLLLAGLAASGGQFSITAAYSYAPAKDISVYDYSQILFSAFLGFIVFGQIPDLLSWIGYIVITGTSVVMFFYGTRKKQ